MDIIKKFAEAVVSKTGAGSEAQILDDTTLIIGFKNEDGTTTRALVTVVKEF